MTGVVYRLGGLAIALVLAGCEDMIKESKPEPAKLPAALYTEIGAADLLERWSVLPNGAVHAPASRRGMAAATDGFSGLSSIFRFSDAREYGACVVFTVMIDEQQEDGVYTHTAHIIDCPGAATAGNAVTEGIFHAAHMCERSPHSEAGYFTYHILRAGDFSPALQPDPEFSDVMLVRSTIGNHSALFNWVKRIMLPGASAPVELNWAYYISGYAEGHPGGATVNTAGFDTLHQHTTDLRWSIDHSTGVVDVEANDCAAFTEYQRRCESL